MSDETASSPENSESPAAESVPRAKKVSTPRPKKAAKKAVAEKTVAPAPVEVEVASIPFPSAPVSAPDDSSEPASRADGEWPEPDAASTGGNASPSESGKRKRRRRKGKGQSNGPQNAAGPSNQEEHGGQAVQEPRPSDSSSQDQRPRPNPQPSQPQPPRAKVDPELLTKMAWKIYLAEVSEEGVALIGDNDAKDLSRRCFRLAEIFVEEQMRRR
ncbi:MAG: hypothetical protein V4584_14830 [Verrucomicrobiota bacterium]